MWLSHTLQLCVPAAATRLAGWWCNLLWLVMGKLWTRLLCIMLLLLLLLLLWLLLLLLLWLLLLLLLLWLLLLAILTN